jgi:hypothetical protein
MSKISVLILAITLGGLISYAEGQARFKLQSAEEVPSSKWDATILALDKEAVAEAYKDQVMRLFQTWMKDPTGQPTRALTGVQNAKKAFIAAMDVLEKRMDALEKRERKQ